MIRLNKNEKGFSALILVLIAVVVVAIGIAGWLVYKNHFSANPRDYKTNQTLYINPEENVGGVCGYTQYRSTGATLPLCIADSIMLDSAINNLFPHGETSGPNVPVNVVVMVADTHTANIKGTVSSNPEQSDTQAEVVVDKILSAHVVAEHQTGNSWSEGP